MNGLTKTSPCVITTKMELKRMFIELDDDRSDHVDVSFNESDDSWTVSYTTDFTLPVWSGNDDIDSSDSMTFENKLTWNEAQIRLMYHTRYNRIAMSDPEEFIDNCINIGWSWDILNSLTHRSVLVVYEALDVYALVHYNEDNIDPAYLDLCAQLNKCRRN